MLLEDTAATVAGAGGMQPVEAAMEEELEH